MYLFLLSSLHQDNDQETLTTSSVTHRWPLTSCNPLMRPPLRSHMWLYPRITMSNSHGSTSKCMDTVTYNQNITTPKDPLDDLDLTTSIVIKSATLLKDNTLKRVVQWPFYKSINQTSITLDDLWSLYLNKNQWVQVPWEYINLCGYSDQFWKTDHIHTYTHPHPHIPPESVMAWSLSEFSSGETKMATFCAIHRTCGAAHLPFVWVPSISYSTCRQSNLFSRSC